MLWDDTEVDEVGRHRYGTAVRTIYQPRSTDQGRLLGAALGRREVCWNLETDTGTGTVTGHAHGTYTSVAQCESVRTTSLEVPGLERHRTGTGIYSVYS